MLRYYTTNVRVRIKALCGERLVEGGGSMHPTLSPENLSGWTALWFIGSARSRPPWRLLLLDLNSLHRGTILYGIVPAPIVGGCDTLVDAKPKSHRRFVSPPLPLTEMMGFVIFPSKTCTLPVNDKEFPPSLFILFELSQMPHSSNHQQCYGWHWILEASLDRLTRNHMMLRYRATNRRRSHS